MKVPADSSVLVVRHATRHRQRIPWLEALIPVSAFVLAGCPGPADLIPKQLSVDSDNVLEVTLENQGEGRVPAGQGRLLVFVDGEALGDYGLGDLADQTFRNPGSSSTVPVDLRISGSHRRVAAYVDPGDEIEEPNELQNTLTRTITPPNIGGPDFIVSDLMLVPNGALRVIVGNVGTSASQNALPVQLEVSVNGVSAADVTHALPALGPGGSATVDPSVPIVISSQSLVAVRLTTNQLTDEIDNTNNSRAETLPAGASLTAYTALIAQPKIRDNLLWQFGDGIPKSYADWSASQKAELDAALLAFEGGERFGLTGPPALIDGEWISAADAWQIYRAHVAQSLWVEVNDIVPWSLLDLTDQQLGFLLGSFQLMDFSPTRNQYRFQQLRMGSITAWNPRISYEFLTNLRLVAASQLETIYAVTDWMRSHLGHILATEDPNVLYGYAGLPPADRVVYALQGQTHTSDGCWGTSGLWGALLRSVNIPVTQGRIELNDGVHSYPIFSSVDRTMTHGDDVYTSVLIPSGAFIPASAMYYSLADFDARFLNPTPDCVAGNCNTVGEQAAYNAMKDHLQLAHDYMADFLLVQYARHGPAYLDDSLRGRRVGGVIEEYVYPFFTDSERAAIIADVEVKLREIGDGNLDAGKAAVIARVDRFILNK